MHDVTFARDGQVNVTRVCRLLSHSPGAAPDRGRSLVSGSTLGPAGVHPQIVAGPAKFSRTLDTLWSVDSQKNSKFGATRCQILEVKCTKFDFRWDFAPDPPGELTASPRLPSCI